MRVLARGVVLPLLAAVSVWGQEQPPSGAGVPPAPASVPPVVEKTVLQNTGKPMALPFHCTEDDIQWAGLTCSEQEPCPIYLELDAAAARGATIVAAGNLHSAAVTLYTVLLVSEDGGQTWTEPHDRVRGAGLDHIQFLDPQTAWVSGLTLFPLPQDPFLLLTTDGGKIWRERPIAGESHPGTITQFFFASRQEGLLLIDRGPAEKADRYERFESPDGGESWTIQEESTKPLKLKQTETASPDWRLRVDGATKSYQVERRQGTRWTPVSAFAVKVGACQPSGGGE